MKYVKIELNGKAFWGAVDGANIRLMTDTPYSGVNYNGMTIKYEGAKLLAPCDPTKIVAIGKNYNDHILEMGGTPPGFPIIFIKPSTALLDPLGTIESPEISNRTDFEGELAFVIKKSARNVKKENYADFILGYTCLNDVTARELQAADGQWARAKGFDTFSPVGPVLTDEVDPSSLDICTRLNGEIKQKSNTKMLMWDIPYLVEYITGCMTLLPGDVVTTGTPSGIGPMQSGDTVEVEIEGIGILRNFVK